MGQFALVVATNTLHSFFALAGVWSHDETVQVFCMVCVMLAAARGLDLPALDCIVQYDPPEETTEYAWRECVCVGREW